MKNAIPNESQIQTFVDAGSRSLRHHTFVSDKLNKHRGKHPSSELLLLGAGHDAGTSPDTETGVHFRLNQTGNIFYATTSPELQKDTRDLFNSVTVLFAAMTKALADKKKTLFDYAAWTSLISKSGYFIEVQKFEQNMVIESSSLTIDTQVVQQLLPGITSGNSMEIAKSVLSAINGTYSSKAANDESKSGHILFICEELFGAPSVTVRLFFASKKSHEKITASPCHKTTSTTIEQVQQADTFLFVSPDTIAQFAGRFGEHPESYTKLIEKLSGLIT